MTQIPERGTVKMFDHDRRFGFIRPDNPGAQDVFIHARVLSRCGVDSLEKGDRVEFEAVADERGRHAEWVQLTNLPTPVR